MMSSNYLNFRLIGILRTKHGTSLRNTIKAIECALEAGLEAAEITSNSKHWQEVVSYFSNNKSNIGTGSIKTKQLAQEAINCGAKFLVSPGFFDDVVLEAKRNNIPVMPGVFDIPDLYKAIEYKVSQIKFFPANVSCHEELFRAIKEPYRDEFQELENLGWEIIDYTLHKYGTDYIKISSPTSFYKQYLYLLKQSPMSPIVIEYPLGKKGFERLKEFSKKLSAHNIKTYAIGGINDSNINDILTKYSAYGVCPGSSMFDAEAILNGDFKKVKNDVTRHIKMIMAGISQSGLDRA